MVQSAVLALVLAALVLPLVTALRQPAGERRPLLVVLAVALALRAAVGLVLHTTGAWQLTDRGAVTPDEATVDLAARLLERGDDRSPLVLGGSLHTSWLLVSWSVYDLLWNSLLAIKLLNAAIGAALVVPVYLLARELHSLRAARLAAWLVALFPAAIVWSALALREALLALLLTTLVLLSVTALPRSWRGRAGWIGLAGSVLVVLAFTRSYMVPLMFVVLLAAAVLRRRRRLVQLAGAGAAVLVALAAVLVLPTGEQTARVTVALVAEPVGNVYNPLSDCDVAGECEAAADPRSAGSGGAVLPGAELRAPRSGSNAGDELASSLQSVGQKGVVRAFAIAVLAGRPVWRTAEFFFLLQPAVVVWWTVLPLAAAGAVVLARTRRDGALATAGYAAAVVVFLAFTGQFIRHHYMLEPVGLVLAAIGIVVIHDSWREGARGRGARVAVVGASAAMAGAAAVSVLASLIAA